MSIFETILFYLKNFFKMKLFKWNIQHYFFFCFSRYTALTFKSWFCLIWFFIFKWTAVFKSKSSLFKHTELQERVWTKHLSVNTWLPGKAVFKVIHHFIFLFFLALGFFLKKNMDTQNHIPLFRCSTTKTKYILLSEHIQGVKKERYTKDFPTNLFQK